MSRIDIYNGARISQKHKIRHRYMGIMIEEKNATNIMIANILDEIDIIITAFAFILACMMGTEGSI